jgi:hypothetical protein
MTWLESSNEATLQAIAEGSIKASVYNDTRSDLVTDCEFNAIDFIIILHTTPNDTLTNNLMPHIKNFTFSHD